MLPAVPVDTFIPKWSRILKTAAAGRMTKSTEKPSKTRFDWPTIMWLNAGLLTALLLHFGWSFANLGPVIARGEVPMACVFILAELIAAASLLYAIGSQNRRSEPLERTIVENALDVIFLLDNNGKFLKASDSTRALLGYEPHELVGKDIRTLIADAAGRSESSFMPGGNWNSIAVLAKDGQSIDTAWSGCWTDDQSIYVCVMRDVSERKKLERLKSNLLQMITHDIRTPLTSIQLFLTLLGDDNYQKLLPETKTEVHATSAEVGRLTMLVNNLLDIEKGDVRPIQVTRVTSRLAELLDNSISAIKYFAQSRGVQIITPADAQNILLYVDKEMMTQVFVNLLSNAVKFSPDNGIVTVSHGQHDNKHLLEFEDDGPGIPSEFLHLLFDRFQQASVAGERAKGGSGLGLVNARIIVEAHDGTISVDTKSSRQSGAVFIVSLPLGES